MGILFYFLLSVCHVVCACACACACECVTVRVCDCACTCRWMCVRMRGLSSCKTHSDICSERSTLLTRAISILEAFPVVTGYLSYLPDKSAFPQKRYLPEKGYI